jgi:hypothetical protein
MPIAAIVASRVDTEARRLVSECRKAGVTTVLVTPATVAAPGWSYQPGNPADSYFTADGQRYPMLELSGIYVRLPFVTPPELPHLTGLDRGYAAFEVHAFLSAWLTDLGDRVLNRPSPSLLAGPGLKVTDIVDPPYPALRQPFTGDVTIVGSRTFGTTPRSAEAADRIRDISRRIHCRFFTLTFESGTATMLNYWPDLGPTVSTALSEEIR